MMTQPIISHIGFNTTTLPDGDLDALDNLLAEYIAVGCDMVELTARRLDVIINGKLNEPRVGQVQAIMEKYDLVVAVHAPHAINLMDEPRLDRQIAVTYAAIEFCAALGATNLVIHAGRVPTAIWHESSTRLLERERDTLRALADFAQTQNVQLAVENLAAGPHATTICYGSDLRRLAEQIARVDHPHVCGCLDFSHGWVAANYLGYDYAAAVQLFSPYVNHLHLHDSCGNPVTMQLGDPGDQVAFGEGDLHLPPGWGTIDWAGILPTLALRPGTLMGIELHKRYWNELQTVVDTAHSFAQILNRQSDQYNHQRQGVHRAGRTNVYAEHTNSRISAGTSLGRP